MQKAHVAGPLEPTWVISLLFTFLPTDLAGDWRSKNAGAKASFLKLTGIEQKTFV